MFDVFIINFIILYDLSIDWILNLLRRKDDSEQYVVRMLKFVCDPPFELSQSMQMFVAINEKMDVSLHFVFFFQFGLCMKYLADWFCNIWYDEHILTETRLVFVRRFDLFALLLISLFFFLISSLNYWKPSSREHFFFIPFVNFKSEFLQME